MDTKESWLLDGLGRQFRSGTFGERDALAFLILLRRHCPQSSLIRELGDFVAHRERDRGILQRYITDFQRVANGLAPEHTHSSFPISTHDLRISLNNVLRALQLPELDYPLANQLTVSIIALLQSVEVKVSGRPSSKLRIGLSASQVALLGQARLPAGHSIVFPLLIAENDFEQLSPAITEYILLEHVSEAQCIGGTLSLEQRAPAV